MHNRMTDDEVRQWAIAMATSLSYYEDEHDYPSDITGKLDDFYSRMPHLTRESASDISARLDA